MSIDTSGTVRFYSRDSGHADQGGHRHVMAWDDLTPDVQGYLTALYETDLDPRSSAHWGRTHHLHLYATFADLSGETLQQAIEDCADARRSGYMGVALWRRRQSAWEGSSRLLPQLRDRYPALTVYLDADGKVRTR